tara:strand:+ start:244 stop:498 length:255 start_codon:yes stop_codon:yes gene_type:complete
MSECKMLFGSICALDLYDGKPSVDDCKTCESYQGVSRGLGDKIHNVSKVTGINAITKAFSKTTKRPCGCNKRRAKLNEQFPAKD